MSLFSIVSDGVEEEGRKEGTTLQFSMLCMSGINPGPRRTLPASVRSSTLASNAWKLFSIAFVSVHSRSRAGAETTPDPSRSSDECSS